ncbi:MAG: DUF3822 family protein [Odoribacter sp.]
MQNVYYIDNNFVKENSLQYILSIRYSTDGLSFCVHDYNNRLLVFFLQPYNLDSSDAVIAKVKKIIVDDELLNLKYKKVYILTCGKDKILLPAHIFNKNYLPDMYRLSLQPQKNDTLLYQKIKIMESYIVEALPRNFVTFLSSRYPSLCIVNSAYPFIIHSLSNIQINTHHLFIDIHDQYFDVLLTRSNDVLLFNSFEYSAIPDLIYYSLNCLLQSNVNKDNLQTTVSGNLVNDPQLLETLSKYIPHISVLSDAPLSQLIKNNELNHSSFFHLLNIHQCE